MMNSLLLALILTSATPDIAWNLPQGLTVVSVKTTAKVSLAGAVAEWSSPPRVGSQSVRLRVPGQEKPIFAFVKVAELHMVLVAARPLVKGTIVRAGDMRSEESAAEGLDVPATSVIGSRLQSNLQTGAVLQKKDLQLAPPVARGAAVTVISVRGGVKVSVAGQLYQDCRIGERCRVTTSIQRQALYGRLHDATTFVLEAQ